MKLRQKLAAVLAATMVVTAVPVVTMAASTNRITKSLTVAKDAKIGVTTTKGTYTVDDKTYDKIVDPSLAPKLIIEAKDTLNVGDIFFLKIKEGEFLDVEEYATGRMGNAGAEFEARRISGSELQITVKDVVTDPETVEIPLFASAKSGETVVEIIQENSAVSAGSFVIARTNEAKATLEVGDASTFYTEGTIADITLEEAYVDAFIAGADDDGNIKVELTIDHDDFRFTGDQSNVAVLGRGLATATPLKANLVVDDKDDQVATVTFKKSDIENLDAKARGNMKISGVKVKSTAKAPETGDLNVVIGGKLVSETTKKVATVADYGVNLKMKDEKAVEIKEGRTDRVTFTLAENVNDSMVDGRPIEFIFDNGHISHTTSTVISVGATDNDEIRKIKLGDTELKLKDDYTIDEIWDEDEEKVIGFEFTLNKKKLDPDKIDKLTFEDVQVHAPLGNSGDITIKASGRMLGEEVETTAVTIKDAFEFETEAMSVKVGLRNQVGGKVVISETEKGSFKKGEKLVLDIEDGCGEFVKEPKVTVTEGDLKLNDVETKITKDGKLEITIKRASKEASTIEITDFVVDVDRTVPQGGFELNVGGAALTDCASTTVEDFFRVGTPNTEDIANGMKKGTASFVNGSTTYTVNTESKTMDAAPYISKAGRMMLPVRYVSEAFGIEGNNVIFADGTVTILAGTRTLQLKNGSEVAVLNGAQIKMAEKVVIKEGRTYVPVGEVGRLLGVSVSFDDATKTATFENK